MDTLGLLFQHYLILISVSELYYCTYPTLPPDLVHFILLEASNQGPNDEAWQSFLLDNGLLKLQLLEEEFGLTRIKIKIGECNPIQKQYS